MLHVFVCFGFFLRKLFTRKNKFKFPVPISNYIYSNEPWTGNTGNIPDVVPFSAVMADTDAAPTDEKFKLVKGETDLKYQFQITVLYVEDILQQLA